ncbi:unnamed protein product [Moneuplotes crassus]|uniref:Uncharacterized protein n=1 Tax=Euplotes crassus TaxID=5936 RepID=A0AAD1Y102_EUPCR|nr:unnamed protein product [Moneuplotes crassus]
MSLWKERTQGQYQKEKQAERLDCFLTITYIYPHVLDPKDVDTLAKRETELTLISKYFTYGTMALYGLGLAARIYKRGMFPYFSDWVKHAVLFVGGGLGTGLLAEKIACETYYNKILINMSNKYAFTPQEVTELQRNLNEYYIEREREEDLARGD